jgi:hypothetical protein
LREVGFMLHFPLPRKLMAAEAVAAMAVAAVAVG